MISFLHNSKYEVFQILLALSTLVTGVTMEIINTADYLFIKFRSKFIRLDEITKEYYPHLCKEKVLEKARQQKFPFTCFRIDESQKGPFFVNIVELATALDEIYNKGYQNFRDSTIKSIL